MFGRVCISRLARKSLESGNADVSSGAYDNTQQKYDVPFL